MADPWATPESLAAVASGLVGVDLSAPGLTGVVELVVPPTAAGRRGARPPAGSPAEARLRVSLADGRVEACETGPATGAVGALVTFTLAAPDARNALEGVEPSVLYMRGRLKVDGDPGAALAILAATAGPGWGPGLAAAVAHA